MTAAAPGYALGERGPARIVEPAGAAEVAATLAACDAAGEAVVPFGGGTLQGIGNAPSRYDVALALRRLDAVCAYDPHDLTIGVEAGMTLAALDERLAREGQMLPLDAPHPARATVGGTLAGGWLGPRRAAYGRPRDLLIGTVAALTDGTLAHAGGMVVKNVTGYDVGKLYVGALGTLGVIVRANFKTLPLPGARRLATAPLSDDVRERAIAAIAGLALEPVAALIVDGFGDDPRLALLFEGSETTVERATREARSALGRAGVAETTLADGDRAARGFAAIVELYVQSRARTVTWRELGLPATAWERARHARRLGAETIADLRTGDVIARCAADVDIRAALTRATLLAGSPAQRAALDAWGPPPATLATMRALKARFDPRGTLAPGRYVGGI